VTDMQTDRQTDRHRASFYNALYGGMGHNNVSVLTAAGDKCK